MTQPAPGADATLAPSTTTLYDVRGNVYQVTDALGHTTTYLYDAYNRLQTEIDPNGHGTGYTYYDTGMRHTLIDPDGNTTTWAYDALNRVETETNELDDTRTYTYDGGLLSRIVDRLDRVTDFAYDQFGRQSDEYWYGSVSAADNDTNRTQAVEHLAYTYYDASGSLHTASDTNSTTAITSSYHYTPDALGRVTGISQSVTGLPDVVFAQDFNGNGNRTQLAATINGTADFVNDYQFDNLGRMKQVVQGANGGNVVAQKRVDFTYTATSQFDTISRYAYNGTTAAYEQVASSHYGYDNAERLTSLDYTLTNNPDAPAYTWNWDRANRIIGFTSAKDAASGSFGSVVYSNDAAGQLTDAVYSNWLGTPGAEDYNYDANGNRINDGYTVPTTDGNNRMATGAGFHYSYDDEGNRTQRYKLDGNNNKIDITDYEWDNRNRLTKITNRATDGGAATQVVEYTYDYANRWLGEKITVPGETSATITQKRFVYDGNQIVLQFEKTGDGGLAASHLTRRDLWGAAVDQLLAEEDVSNLGSEGEVLWALTDHQNTVRDLATYDFKDIADPNDGVTSIAEHRSYDSFGKRLSAAAVDCIFGYTGRPYDQNTETDGVIGSGIQNNLNRWYEAITHKWLSEDPIAADVNSYRYCSNNPTDRMDPLGLVNSAPPPPLPLTWPMTVSQIQAKIAAFRADFQKKHPTPFGCNANEFEEAGKETSTYEFLTLETQNWNGEVGKPLNNDLYLWLVHNVTQLQQEYAVTGTLERREIFKVTERQFRCCWCEQGNLYQIICPELFSTKHSGEWQSRYTIVDEGPRTVWTSLSFIVGGVTMDYTGFDIFGIGGHIQVPQLPGDTGTIQ